MSLKVHEIAKELIASSKEIMDLLREMGIDVRNHMTPIEDDVIEKVKAEYARHREEQKANRTAGPRLPLRVPSVLHTPLTPARENDAPAEAPKVEAEGEKRDETGEPKKRERRTAKSRDAAAQAALIAAAQGAVEEELPAQILRRPTPDRTTEHKPAPAASEVRATAERKPAAERRTSEARPPRATQVKAEPAHVEPTPAEVTAKPAAATTPAAAAEPETATATPAAEPRVEMPVVSAPEPEPTVAVPATPAPIPTSAEAIAEAGEPVNDETIVAAPAATPAAAAPKAALPGGGPRVAAQRPAGAAAPGPIMPAGTSRPAPAAPRQPLPGGGPRPAGTTPRPAGTAPTSGPRPAGTGPRPAGTGPISGPRPAGSGPRPAGLGPSSGPRPASAGGARPGGGAAAAAPAPASGTGRPPIGGGGRRKPGSQDFRSRKREAEERERERRTQLAQRQEAAQQQRERKPLAINEDLSVKELADKMDMRASEVIRKLIALGVMATVNQTLDVETARIVATELGFPIKEEEPVVEEQLDPIDDPNEPDELKQLRPPVVTVMGHVDHGKTSLLDAIRNTNVTAREAGGITQHIGASTVEINGRKIVFLDTPGHAAFTSMRARGAKVTDIAILVVAADDSVMPQTVEAINHVKAAGVPIIVAINKMDTRGADPQRVKTDLTQHGLVVEEWGGDTVAVPVSAKTGEGIEQLLEMILLVADVQDLKANPNKDARGTIIEAEIDKGRGPVATVLIQSGTLTTGDTVVAGLTFGKVRAMFDDKGRKVKKAGPSTAVEVLGLTDVPLAGDAFFAVESEQRAREIAEKKQSRKRAEEMVVKQRITLEDLMSQAKAGEVKELNAVLKADVQGSVEAVKAAIEKLSTNEVKIKVIHAAVGAINESDVTLATASAAIIIGFNVRPDANARRSIERDQVDVRLYSIIYEAVEDIKRAMEGMLEPEEREVVLGHAEVRQVFKVPKFGTICGSYCSEGKIIRGAMARLVRNGIVIQTAKIDSLRRIKDDVHEVAAGYECGIHLENYNDVKEGDVIEAFTIEKVKREL